MGEGEGRLRRCLWRGWGWDDFLSVDFEPRRTSGLSMLSFRKFEENQALIPASWHRGKRGGWEEGRRGGGWKCIWRKHFVHVTVEMDIMLMAYQSKWEGVNNK